LKKKKKSNFWGHIFCEGKTLGVKDFEATPSFLNLRLILLTLALATTMSSEPAINGCIFHSAIFFQSINQNIGKETMWCQLEKYNVNMINLYLSRGHISIKETFVLQGTYLSK
jgi:hypothetical protein